MGLHGSVLVAGADGAEFELEASLITRDGWVPGVPVDTIVAIEGFLLGNGLTGRRRGRGLWWCVDSAGIAG